MTTKEGNTSPSVTHGTEAIIELRVGSSHSESSAAGVAIAIPNPNPGVLLAASVLVFGSKVPQGLVVQAVGIAWHEIIAHLDRDPDFLSRMPWRRFEEIIAGGYERAGYRVTLTPASNDRGRDVIAERDDIGKIRIV